MGARFTATLIMGAAMLLAAGCRSAATSTVRCQPACCVCLDDCTVGRPATDSPSPLPVRSTLASYENVDAALMGLSPPQRRQVLTAWDCQCSAVSRSAGGNLLDMERQLVAERTEHKRGRILRNLELQTELLAYRTIEKRNTSAAEALTVFYRLAEVESQQTILQRSLDELATMIARAQEVRRQQLLEEVDLSSLLVQQTDLQNTLVQLRASRLQLNGQLQLLLNCPLGKEQVFWPEVNWNVGLSPIDSDYEVQRGMGVRPELRALRLVHSQLDRQTLPVARAVLSAADGPLGSAPLRSGFVAGLLGGSEWREEVAARSQQYCYLIANSEQIVSGAIRKAALDIEVALRFVALADEKIRSLEERLDDLRKQQAVGRANVFDVSTAKLQLYQAQSDRVTRVIELRIAEVELKQAQGMLAIDCLCSPECGADELAPVPAPAADQPE